MTTTHPSNSDAEPSTSSSCTTAIDLGESKGVGVLASRDLNADEILFRESPLLRLTPDGAGRYDGKYGRGGDREACIARLLTLSMHSGIHRASPLEKVIETNGFVVENGHATVVFECISRLNHSCHSNAAFSWDADASMGVVKVKRPIAAGDEVSLNYGATSGDTQARRQYLEKRFNFVCACPLCTDEDEDDSTALLGMSWPPITDLEARWRCIRVLRGGAEPDG